MAIRCAALSLFLTAIVSIAAPVFGASADVELTADNLGPLIAGYTYGYQINIRSLGPDSPSDMSWSLTLPAGTTFYSLYSGDPAWSCTTPAQGQAGTVTCSIAAATNVPYSVAFAIDFTVDAALPPGTVLSTTATVTSSTPDPNPANNSATVTTTVFPAADLFLGVTDAPDPVLAGNDVTYTITAFNRGPSYAWDVTMSDALPAEATFVSVAGPPGWSCSTPAVGATGTVSCHAPNFALGATVTFTVVLHMPIDFHGPADSEVRLISPTGSLYGSDIRRIVERTIVSELADLVTSVDDSPDPVAPGGTLTYTILVRNAGPTNASNVWLLDELPVETVFQSVSAPSGWSCAPSSPPANVYCTGPATLPVGDSVFTLTVTVKPDTPPGTVLHNLLRTPNTDDYVVTATTVGTQPSSSPLFFATKTAAGAFVPGGTVTYTVNLTNNTGLALPDNASDEFVDVLPSSLALVSASATSGSAISNSTTNTVTWNGALASGASVEITITATVLAASGTIENQGTAYVDLDHNGSNETAVNTDDPSTAAASDATGIAIAGAFAMPTLSPAMLLLMAALLAIAALRRW